MKKIFITILLVILLPVLVFADSFTFSTSIDGVSNGPNGFGWGLFPLGTSFTYAKYFPMLKENFEQARLNVSTSFSFSDNWIVDAYTYDGGIPYWSMTVKERYSEEIAKSFVGGRYFNPRGNLYLYLQQGFGTNPVSKSGSLVNIRFAWNTNYSMALEGNPFFPGVDYLSFVNTDGTPKAPFGPDTKLPSMPWLQDNRININNNIALSTYWNFDKWTGTDAADGIYIELTLEAGPSWLANTISPRGVHSNYWKAYGYMSEKLTLFSVKQDNGMNWATMYVGHNNSYSYTGGDVVPENKIPGDRLRHCLSDAIWIHFAGPQFIAGDCYSYIELGLYNNIYFGNVVNEVSQKTQAIELQSSFSGLFHLRLFGFIRFDYSFGYVFNRGLYAANPYWWQSAEVRFYVTV